METKWQNAFTTLEPSNQDGLTSIKLTQTVLKETVLEVKLDKSTVEKVIAALKKLSE